MDSLELTQAANTGDDGETTGGEGFAELGGRFDIMQLLFWGCLLISIAAASVALAWPKASGAPGPILLISMASGGLVFLLWSVRGAGRSSACSPNVALLPAPFKPTCPASAGSRRSTNPS